MDLDEQIALRLAQERVEEALQTAEYRRALRSARAHSSARVRLGNALVRLGHWMMGEP